MTKIHKKKKKLTGPEKKTLKERIEDGVKLREETLKLAKDVKRLTKEQREAHERAERTEPWRRSKFLWYSVAPWIKSGYGVVTGHMVNGLANRGLPILISAYYGIHSGGFLKMGPIVVLPVLGVQGDKFGFGTTIQHYEKFKCDALIYHTDFWIAKALTKRIRETHCYTPIDHEDYDEEYQDVLKSFRSVSCPSKHGVAELKKYGIKATYIPHGVDINVYKPLDKISCRKMIGVPPKAFVIGMVAANNDKEPRKGWDKMFQAIQMFTNNNPKAVKNNNFKVFVHSRANDPRGYNLVKLAKRLKISKYIIFQDPYMTIIGLPASMMCRIYNSFDVLMNCSRREGYGIPMTEAQACGVPVIATKLSAMIERLGYGKAGWLTKPMGTMLSPINSVTAIPDEHAILEALQDAYDHPKKRKKFAKAGYQLALQQTWDIAVDKHMLPWIKKICDNIPSLNPGKPEKVDKSWKKLAKKVQK